MNGLRLADDNTRILDDGILLTRMGLMCDGAWAVLRTNLFNRFIVLVSKRSFRTTVTKDHLLYNLLGTKEHK
jgi:hypothetical protein